MRPCYLKNIDFNCTQTLFETNAEEAYLIIFTKHRICMKMESQFFYIKKRVKSHINIAIKVQLQENDNHARTIERKKLLKTIELTQKNLSVTKQLTRNT